MLSWFESWFDPSAVEPEPQTAMEPPACPRAGAVRGLCMASPVCFYVARHPSQQYALQVYNFNAVPGPCERQIQKIRQEPNPDQRNFNPDMGRLQLRRKRGP